jgi:psiF repeat
MADGLQPFCESQATNKKLAGAAKTSFMKKCQFGK